MNKKKFSLRVVATTTIIALIVSGLSLGVSIYSQFPKHNPNVCVTKTSGTIDFLKQSKDTTKTYDTIKVQPCKGQYYLTLYQSSGKANTKYTVYAKKDSAKSYTNYGTLTLKNGTESKKLKVFKATNSKTIYYIKIVKTNYNKTKSRVKQTIRIS